MSTTTHADVMAHRQAGPWRTLERIALELIADVQRQSNRAFAPTLGGGTRLMLALNHRISHDIDLFIRDPQWIGYLSPRLNDSVESVVDDYEEAADFLKLKLPAGEIDFIVRGSLLNLPTENCADTPFPLEPVAEVLAKKLFYRGALLTPRDLFDWCAVEANCASDIPEQEMGGLLLSRHAGITNALDLLRRSPVARTLWDDILAPDKPELETAVSWGLGYLERYRHATEASSVPTARPTPGSFEP